MSSNQNRVQAGVNSKNEGHIFEETVAAGLGGKTPKEKKSTKVDVIDGCRHISIKNTNSKSTQIHLGTQNTLIEGLGLVGDEVTALKLFLGFSSKKEFIQHLKLAKININNLDSKSEIGRHRVKGHNIPTNIFNSLIDKLNSKKDELFSTLFTHGTKNFTEDLVATHMIVTKEKNNFQSCLAYDMMDLKNVFCQGTWNLAKSKSTISLEYVDSTTGESIRICHLQLKGSGGKSILGNDYHSPMFHAHKPIFKIAGGVDMETFKEQNK